MKKRVAAAFLALALAGCASGGLASKSSSGFDLSPYAATEEPNKPVAGIVGGGLISGSIGNDLNRHGKRQALEAEYKALETASAGQPIGWSSGGANGQVIAGQPYRVGSQNCRQYSESVGAGISAKTARGTACRNDDGSWTLLN